MLFLQEGPAETTGFMLLGFAVIFGVLFLHVASLVIRQRNLKRDLEVLEEVSKKS